MLDKQFGPGKVVQAKDAKALAYERLPSGSVQLDRALGGGFPLGRIIEFLGLEGHGKTTVLLKTIAENQKAGRTCALVATEEFDTKFARTLGVNLDELELSVPESLEEMIDLVEVLVASREIVVIGIDSITGGLPLFVQERSADEPTRGVEAKLNNLFCRKVVTAMAPGNLTKKENRPWCTVIYTNQLRATMGSSKFPLPPEAGGGMGLKFFKSISVFFRRLQWINNVGKVAKASKDKKWGQTIMFMAKKNKTFIPYGMGEIDFYFRDSKVVRAGQYDSLRELIALATELNVIKQKGSYFYIANERFQGKEILIDALRADMGIMQLLKDSCNLPFWYYEIKKKREIAL